MGSDCVKPTTTGTSAFGCVAVKVVDFGIAAQSDLPDSMVQGSGTVPYMSPEQLERRSLDARSDIWSTGVTLFELLTGHIPYRSLREILSAPPPELPRGFPLSGEINAVLARALARDRRMRYPKAEELGADLRRLQQTCERTNLSAIAGGATSIDNGARVAAEPVPSPSTLDTAMLTRAGDKAPAGGPARVGEAPLEGQSYVLTDLNFSRPAQGDLRSADGTSKWRERKRLLVERWSRFSRAIQRFLDRLGRIISVINALKRIPPLLALPFLPLFLSLFLLYLLAIVVVSTVALLGGLALAVAIGICSVLEIADRLPTCQGCRLRMRQTASWVRLVKSREEVIFGYRDCMAALKHRLWEEAAKLLSIHGAEHVSEYGSRFITPARYHLNFYECTLCGHHAARLTMDEMVGGKWERQAKFGEAYWGEVGPRPSLSSTLAAAPGAYLRVLSELVENLIKIEINRLVLMTSCLAALFMALILWLWAKH